jgi:hypothetical protein
MATPTQQRGRERPWSPARPKGKIKVAAWGIQRAWSWAGSQYVCQVCNVKVLERQANAHNQSAEHAKALIGSGPWRPGRLPNVVGQKQAKVPAAPPAPLPRKPSPDRQAAPKAPPAPAPPAAPAAPKRAKYAKQPHPGPYSGEIKKRSQTMAGNGNGNTNGSPTPAGGGGSKTQAANAAHGLVLAYERWANTEIQTVAELRDFLLATDIAHGKIADIIHTFGMNHIAAKRIHPAVAQPIDAAADAMAGLRHFFSMSYHRFEAIYADILGYKRDGSRPKPQDSMFADV